MKSEDAVNFVELASRIVAAYVGNHSVPTSDLPGLIREIHGALSNLDNISPEAPSEPAKPAVNPKKSIHPEYLVCLEDGLKFKSLKRHLRTKYGLSPEQYREKWGLAPDYPMVAPSYARARSTLAKQMGLGQTRKRRGA
ncbi:MAG: MucR family transcriptional regulator [Rhizobiales bacterium 65-9]|nr:MucR family transcriptional regulator [Hyphomicrobiales bacterium]OJY37993.1 MAG: MucR family transcriptional regulator [Rhizobiales bacterium 65-9]